VLVPAGVPGLPCPFFMFGQLCVALGEADGEGVAVLADAALTDAVPEVAAVVDVFADDVVVAEWLVAALATARLPPNPTPSAPAPTAVPITILPSLPLTVSASSWSGDGPEHRTPTLAAAALQLGSDGGMRSGSAGGERHGEDFLAGLGGERADAGHRVGGRSQRADLVAAARLGPGQAADRRGRP